MSVLTVAVVQASAPLFDTASALTRAEQLIGEAAAKGAKIIVLPEAFLGGYPKGLDFGITVGNRSPAGRDLFLRYYESAIDVPDGPEVRSLAKITSQLAIYAVVGAVERSGATLYCVALYFGPKGYLGLHRKLVPTAAERYLWGRGDGSTMPVIDTGAVRLGAGICWENFMPLFRTAMYAKGLDVWCAPTVDDRDTWQSTVRHIALEGRCFVLAACQYMTRDKMPPDVEPVQGNAPDTVLIGGGSVIVSPMGQVLAGPLRHKEGILTADLDLSELVRARFDFDPVGHYARPDLFSLYVNESSQLTVIRQMSKVNLNKSDKQTRDQQGDDQTS